MVSIIVPIYGVERYLDQCIESIVAQTYFNLEILLIDDGSPDQCPQMADEWALRDKRITVVHKKNGGLSDARNCGLERATGEYIVFVDSDDWIEREYVERMLDASIRENADVVACTFVNELEATHETVIREKPYFSGGTEEALAMLYDDTRIGATAIKFYRRRIWENLRFPKGKLYEDALTVYQVFDLADRIAQIPDALYHYRIRENSIMTSKFSVKNVRISEAWKENYLFCAEKYPSVANSARATHPPADIAISQNDDGRGAGSKTRAEAGDSG